MELIVIYLAVVFGCGLIAWVIRLPPLVGFLAAGFVLSGLGVEHISGLSQLADLGVTLMLFAIGLRLDLRALLGKEVWLTGAGHMLVMTLLGTGILAAMSALGVFGPESLGTLAVLALVLSFSSTIFVVKVLQGRGDEQTLYGTICIGVLIMQDIVAVAVISISRGQPPKWYALGLVLLIPALAWTTKYWHKLGHGELGALFGIAMALIPGYALFEWLGLSGSLGALIMGLILAPRPGANDLSRSLFTVKELLLVGFFVNVGFSGSLTLTAVGVGLLLLAMLPVQAVAYWGVMHLIGLRNRTNVLASLALSNYSEFALIVAAMGVSAGWLTPQWMPSLVVAVSAGFVISAVVNPHHVARISRLATRLPGRPSVAIIPADRPITIGAVNAVVLGMGRVGRATYEQLAGEHGYTVLGVEHDTARVHALRAADINVVEGDATDHDFWQRLVANGLVQIVVLAMPSQQANIEALAELRRRGYPGTVAAVALLREDVEELEALGLTTIVHLYAGAGEALADRAATALSRQT